MAHTKLTKDILIQLKKAGIATGCASEHPTDTGSKINVDITADIPVEQLADLFENCEVKTAPYGPKKEHNNVMWSHVYSMITVTIDKEEAE